MNINLTPMRRDDQLVLSKSGDTLTINGEDFDFSGIPDGATLPREAVTCDWLASDIERIGGVLHLTLILPHGEDAHQETLFPQPIAVTTDGQITVPVYETPAVKEMPA